MVIRWNIFIEESFLRFVINLGSENTSLDYVYGNYGYVSFFCFFKYF